jgi:hypothetical protein
VTTTTALDSPTTDAVVPATNRQWRLVARPRGERHGGREANAGGMKSSLNGQTHDADIGAGERESGTARAGA